jgi:imidazolonepropionase-like amidohydrolase
MMEGILDAKQDLAHMEEIIYGYFPDELDESKIPDLSQHIKDSGISIIAILIAYHKIIRQIDNIESMINSSGVSEVPTLLTRSWQAENNTYLKRFSPESNDSYLPPSFSFIHELTKAFHEAGIPILMGTDACISIVVPGYSAHDELKELVDSRLSPYAEMAYGTRETSIFLNAEHEIGTIEVGKGLISCY